MDSERVFTGLSGIVRLEPAHDARWVPHDHSIGRDVVGDDCSAPNDTTAAEADPGQHDGVEADPDVLFENDRARR